MLLESYDESLRRTWATGTRRVRRPLGRVTIAPQGQSLLGVPTAMRGDVTQVLSRIEAGEPQAAEELLPLVYEELRKLAAAKMAQERPGQTLQATALVHEAYLRLVDHDQAKHWDSRGHFFAAAAEAMRRILVDRARQKNSRQAGGALERVELDQVAVEAPDRRWDLLALNEALEKLEQVDPRRANLVKLRFFAGLSIPAAATVLGIANSTAIADWAYAKGWLRVEMLGDTRPPAPE